MRKLRENCALGVALSALFFACTICAQAPQTNGGTATAVTPKAAKEKEETCRISGFVLKMADGTPLKNATVRLENEGDHEHTIATKTAPDGRFELRNIPPGRYKVKVTRNGYVEKEYGQVKPSDPGAALTLAPGENKTPMEFKLTPAAVIAGRVFDEDGEPVPQVMVIASREIYQEGTRTLSTTGFAQTDDLGQFRLFGLAPGKYYVSAAETGWGSVTGDREFAASAPEGTERGYTKTYYPGATELAKASAISVKEGDEVPGTDIQLKQVPVYRIRGRVLNQFTHKGGKDAAVQLMNRTKRLEWDFGAGQDVKKSDGSFEFANVVPGSYLLMAFWEDQGKMYSTQERVDIGESDLEGVSLMIGSGTTILGHIRWEGKPSVERNELSVSVRPADTPFLWGASARTEVNQQFTLKDVGDGEYKVSVTGFTKDCYIKDTVYGDAHSAEGVITVSKGGSAHLEVTISSRGARVQGAVVDKDGLPAAGVWVVAVPDEARRMNFGMFKAQTTDQYGKFDLHGLVPGSYKMFSWAGIENGEWEDTDFLKPFEDKGERVELQDDDVRSVSLKVIEKNSERGE